MRRKASLLLSIAFMAVYIAKNFGSGEFLQSLAFTLPPLAADIVAVALLVRVWRKEPVSQDDSWTSFWVSILGAHLFMIANLAGFTIVSESAFKPLQVACGIALSASYPLAIYTMLVLGRSFSVIPEARQLVTVGPYRWSRHPLYVLYIFWYVLLLGIGQSVAVVVLSTVNTVLQVMRARREERVLLSVFGDEYARYRSDTMWVGRRPGRRARATDEPLPAETHSS